MLLLKYLTTERANLEQVLQKMCKIDEPTVIGARLQNRVPFPICMRKFLEACRNAPKGEIIKRVRARDSSSWKDGEQNLARIFHELSSRDRETGNPLIEDTACGAGQVASIVRRRGSLS
jgi:hypothetical protein